MRLGYEEVAWMNGGFDQARPGDLETRPENIDMRYGGVGGVSGLIGYTEVQREEREAANGGKKEQLTSFTKLAMAILVADGLLYVYEVATGKAEMPAQLAQFFLGQ